MAPIPGVSAQRKRKSASISAAVPDVQLVSIEHPCIVRNVDAGFKSLGGEQQVKHILEPGSDQDARPRKAQRRVTTGAIVGVSLHPHDPLAKKLESTPNSTHGVLVKVTLPKWTGRKRKRGSEDAFLPSASPRSGHEIMAPDVIRRLLDNAGNHSVEAVGSIETSHRFDSLPDIRIREQDVPVMRELKQHGLTPDYDVLKDLHIDLTPGTNGIKALPRPGHFVPPDIANNENPFELYRDIPHKPQPHTAKYDPYYYPDGEIPTKLKPLVDALAAYFETRPIATRLVLQYAFPDIQHTRLDVAATWVGTKPKEGPWKDCIIKRGIDPALDPQYRVYQIVAVRPQNKGEKEDSGSHVFDGETKTKGRTYQYCDITDPPLAKIVNTQDFRSLEEGYGGPSCGWYHSGSVAKMKVLMAHKIRHMQLSSEPLDERIYAALAALPDKVDEDTVPEFDWKEYGAEAKSLAKMIRTEALRLGREAVEYAKGGNASGIIGGVDGAEDADGDEAVVTGELAIDPSLLEDGQGAIGDGFGDPLSDETPTEGRVGNAVM